MVLTTDDSEEIKLTRFDSIFYLPASIPLIHIDPSDTNSFYNGVGFDTLRRVFREETNRDGLIRAINAPLLTQSTCACGWAVSPYTKDILSHLFSQQHMAKFIQKRGSVSNKDFSFWMRLLKLFPKDRSRISPFFQQQQLEQLSTALDLHSQTDHWTVEVSSVSEKTKALYFFVSSCFARSEQVNIYVANKKEAQEVNLRLLMKFPDAVIKISPPHWELMYLLVSAPGLTPSTDSVVFLRPPSIRSNADDGNSTTAPENSTSCAYAPGVCAFLLCSSRGPQSMNSLMIVNGSEEMAAFRAFEKKFASSAPPLSICSVSTIQTLAEVAKCEAQLKQQLELEKKKAEVKELDKKKEEEVVKQEEEEQFPVTFALEEEKPAIVTSRRNRITVTRKKRESSTEKTARKSARRVKREKENKRVGNVEQPICWDDIDEDDEVTVKERPPIFIPFDVEMGKAVGEWIEETSWDEAPEATIDPSVPRIEMNWNDETDWNEVPCKIL